MSLHNKQISQLLNAVKFLPDDAPPEFAQQLEQLCGMLDVTDEKILLGQIWQMASMEDELAVQVPTSDPEYSQTKRCAIRPSKTTEEIIKLLQR